jgi:DNA recombination protein RmuC
VRFGWRQERIAESAQQISALGRELYDRLRVFGEHMDRCGHGLPGAVEHCNRAVGSLESRVMVSARKFRDLGSGTTDDVPVLEAVDITPKQLQADDWHE